MASSADAGSSGPGGNAAMRFAIRSPYRAGSMKPRTDSRLGSSAGTSSCSVAAIR
jgi:hypothetical protein